MTSKPFLRLLENSQPPETPPIWLMRQAGRYLPEYRATRETAGGFLDLCYNPALAEEVTLQPIRRYGFDASILFADILLIPHALGQKLWFETGEGPRLTPIMDISTLDGSDIMATLAPVIETVGRLSKSLPAETTLIGFAGAPWTVATYMVAGRGTSDQATFQSTGQRLHLLRLAKLTATFRMGRCTVRRLGPCRRRRPPPSVAR